MEKSFAYKTARVAGALYVLFAAHNVALAATQEYVAEYCSDYSMERLTREDHVDEMDLRDQYDLVQRYFADCMARERAEIRKEAAMPIQPALFN